MTQKFTILTLKVDGKFVVSGIAAEWERMAVAEKKLIHKFGQARVTCERTVIETSEAA